MQLCSEQMASKEQDTHRIVRKIKLERYSDQGANRPGQGVAQRPGHISRDRSKKLAHDSGTTPIVPVSPEKVGRPSATRRGRGFRRGETRYRRTASGSVRNEHEWSQPPAVTNAAKSYVSVDDDILHRKDVRRRPKFNLIRLRRVGPLGNYH